MLALFRTNQAYAGSLLFVYALLLQMPGFVFGPRGAVPVGQPTYLGELLTVWAVGSQLWTLLLPPLLIALTGVIANNLCDRYWMSRTVTQLPGLGVVLLWALSPAFHAFDPAQLNHVFLLLAAGALGNTYRGSAEVARFNAGCWLGLASLLQPTYLLFLPAFIVGISIFRTADLRSIAQLVVGICLPYFLLSTYAYVRGELEVLYWGQVTGYGLFELLPSTRYAAIGTALLLLPLLVVLGTAARGRVLLNIQGAKNVSFIYWLLLFSLPVALLTEATGLARAQVAVAPLGLLTGLWLVRQPKAEAEFCHLLFFVAALTLYTVALVT